MERGSSLGEKEEEKEEEEEEEEERRRNGKGREGKRYRLSPFDGIGNGIRNRIRKYSAKVVVI